MSSQSSWSARGAQKRVLWVGRQGIEPEPRDQESDPSALAPFGHCSTFVLLPALAAGATDRGAHLRAAPASSALGTAPSPTSFRAKGPRRCRYAPRSTGSWSVITSSKRGWVARNCYPSKWN